MEREREKGKERERERDRHREKEAERDREREREGERDSEPQPPFGPSVNSLFHPCITTTHLSYRVLSLKFPPPPCAALQFGKTASGKNP
jgi:hypothetical protein